MTQKSTTIGIVFVAIVGLALTIILLNRPQPNVELTAPNRADTAESPVPTDVMANFDGETVEVPDEQTSEIIVEPPVEPKASRSVDPGRGITIEGMVQNARTGTPVAGTKVVASDFLDEIIVSAESDEEGNFTLFLPARQIANASWLEARADGFALNRKDFSELGDSTIGVGLYASFLLHPGAAIQGTVSDFDERYGIEGARVLLVPAQVTIWDAMDMGETAYRSTTDASGGYHLNNIAPGAYRLIADARNAGYMLDRLAVKVVNIEVGQVDSSVDFTLETGGIVTGTVLNSQGAPVSGATLGATPAETFEAMFQQPELALTFGEDSTVTVDEEGLYEIRGLNYDYEYRIIGDAENYATSRSELFRLSKSNSSYTVDLVLTAGSTVSGTVAYEDGAPVANFDVQLSSDDAESFFYSFVDSSEESTDGAGAFVFNNVGAGKYTIEASDFDGDLSDDDSVTVQVDGVNPVTNVRFVVERSDVGTGKIEGVVLTSTGEPAADLSVSIESLNTLEYEFADTDKDGKFSFDRLRGQSFDLEVNSVDGSASLKQVPVNESVVIRLTAPVLISGRVLDEQGLPVPDASIFQVPAEEPDEPWMYMNGFLAEWMDDADSTDDDGYFEIASTETGDFIFKAKSTSRGHGETAPLTIREGRDVTDIVIRLERGSGVSGTVVDSSGRRVPGVTVSLTEHNPDDSADMTNFLPDGMIPTVGSATTDERGEYRIANVPASTYQLRASSPDYAPARLSGITVQPKQDTRNLSIVLSTGGCIAGTARLGGELRQGLIVQFTGDNGMFMATTDSEGAFEVCQIPPGSYMAMAIDMSDESSFDEYDDLMSQMRVVDVIEGETTHIDFEPQTDGIPVTGVIAGEVGEMTTVMLRTEGGPLTEEYNPLDLTSQVDLLRYMAGQAMVHPDGSFDLGLVAPGEYILEVISMDFDFEDISELSISPSIRKEITIKEESEPIHLELEL